jgi:hypothetical protein
VENSRTVFEGLDLAASDEVFTESFTIDNEVLPQRRISESAVSQPKVFGKRATKGGQIRPAAEVVTAVEDVSHIKLSSPMLVDGLWFKVLLVGHGSPPWLMQAVS